MQKTGVIATSRKENESRVPLHPAHLEHLDTSLKEHIVLECGYAERFGLSDARLQSMGFQLAAREAILETCTIVILPKPVPEDLQQLGRGQTLWGWPHCVQQATITEVAIERELTLIAFESMYHWRGEHRDMHIFYRNNELAGYCGVLHALNLVGIDGGYGPSRRVAVLSFGGVSRGAIHALIGRGFSDITVFTQRPQHLVADQILGCNLRQMKRGSKPRDAAEWYDPARGESHLLTEALVDADIIVNGILQDTDRPFMFLSEEDVARLRLGTLIIDISCDEGMGFPGARPTSFDAPIYRMGPATYYAVDHTPSYLWNSASWEISRALLPYLAKVMEGPEAWARDETLARAVDVADGRIRNEKILSFQHRAAEFPHARE